ncbi:T/G mismatch-specific endonuclease [Agrobacterium fabrum]|uniref:very short patch repair endonuclease n=1 Tax=Agrobacterium fabrum TaxID=1176649 RepID=UPI000880FC4D|nr:very short patch repair endonuclease [Agrobacterium fabrum]SDB73003.1 T/G mismatch-specific endonuclease [Agrobacterium fabrum]SES08471.1 T/G mismatch-specific endonuclease [Agrobacterium fabrum]
MDVLTKEQRRLNMSRIRGRDTKPELLLRKGLHARGYRFRVNVPGLPGRPDIVFPKYGAVIQVNGCFWHGHDCHLFKMPASRQEFWAEKIFANRARDRRTDQALSDAGWRLLNVWECSLKGSKRRPLDEVLTCCEAFLRDGSRKVANIPST